MLKSQERFKRGEDNVFTEEYNKISLSANDDKRKQSIQKRNMRIE